MNKFRIATILAVASLAFGLVGAASAQDYDKSFLTDYTKLQAKPAGTGGTELMYIPPGVFERLVKYNGVMVDQPEVLVSPQSDYKGAKPHDLAAIAELLRSGLAGQLTAGGYRVVDAPGADVIYIRMALTDLSLKKKKRGLLAYTPVGFVVKAGADAVKDMMDKYDIMSMALQAELVDSQTNEVLAEIVAVRGGENERMDFDVLNATVNDFGSRLRCRLDNARVPSAQQINCLDPMARTAREATKAAP